MNTHTDVDWRLLQRDGRAINWKRPTCRNRCRKMWRHGWVRRFFEPLHAAVEVQRFFCPECGSVATARPPEFRPRYRTSRQKIFEGLCHRLKLGRWPPAVPRQRGGHWLRKLGVKARMDFPLATGGLLSLLQWLEGKGIWFLR